MTLPSLQGFTHFIEIAEAIVDTGDTRECTGCVVENALDNMRRDLNLCHAGRNGAANVMRRPIGYAAYIIKPPLSFAVPRHWGFGLETTGGKN
jgi:hypothetical protein